MGLTSKQFAFLFPGQGSQSVGMLSELFGRHSEVSEVFTQASEIVSQDLWKLVTSGPEEELHRTENTQPIMLAAGYACYLIWRKCTDKSPAWMAGHSLGEYTALVCADAVAFEEAIKVVRERGLLMQRAVPAGEGAMAAILGLDDDIVLQVCNEVTDSGKGRQSVSAANFNAPGQIVIAGHTEAVGQAVKLLKEKGAKRSLMLPVSIPSHCPLMSSIADEFGRILDGIKIKGPIVPVLQNIDSKFHDNPTEIRQSLIGQLSSPVRWVDTVRRIGSNGVMTFVELGPGKVLTGLTKRIIPEAELASVDNEAGLLQALEIIS